jgi:anti-sigma regulatory factor (Ser/Thr protein kinase)
LVHDNDEQLFEGICAFVDEGLTSGGDVMVLGTRDRLGLLRELVGSDPRLEYGCVEELYLAPMRTLFNFQRMLAERTGPTVLWVTGSVPLGRDCVAQAAWDRYESAVNEALSVYPFRGLCAYDTRTRPAPVIEAARATHPTVSIDLTNRACPEYVDPAAFLAGPLARVPTPPTSPPSVNTTVAHSHDLVWARSLLEAGARSGSAVPYQTIEQFLMAVQEVAANGLFHGGPPVRITLWAEVGALTCLVEDSGPGGLDPMTGFRFPDESGPMGLWAARQLVDDLFIGSSPFGGCTVFMTAT